MISPGLLAAARSERDQRVESYGKRIEAGTIDADAAHADIRCWSDIADFLATGRLPLASPWPELDAAAATAIAHIGTRIANLEGQPNVPPETLGTLRNRRSWLTVIHDRIRTERRIIDDMNRELRRQPVARAA